MALSSLLGSTSPGGRKLCMFEIRTEQEFVVFRGPANETPETSIKGTIVFMTTETMSMKGGMKITFEGRRKTQHLVTRTEMHSGLPASNMIVNKNIFMHQEMRILDSRGHPIRHLSPGNHEFPFEFGLPGDTPESVEGLTGNHITYNLKALCERGVLIKDMVAQKHVRVIRTLGPDALEGAATSAVHGIWPDKIKYLFEPTAKNFMFGTSLATDIELTPLMDKLSITKIRFIIKETRKIKTDPGPEYSAALGKSHGMWKEEQDVWSEQMELPDNCGATDEDTQLPMFKFRAVWQLPKCLQRCRQTVEDNEWIQIKHHAHYDVLLKNPDGHFSELKAHHPIRLFISPNLGFDESHTVVSTPPEIPGDDNPLGPSAPPTYETHQLDVLVPLYDGIDPAGFFTPGLSSGAQTPFNFHSRNASSENLSAYLNDSNGHPNPSTLHNRLRHLQIISEGPTPRHISRHHSHDQTPEESLSPQRSNENDSEDVDHTFHPGSPHTFANTGMVPLSTSQPEHVDYDMTALERITSYNTAVRSSGRPVQADTPPTYDTATSRPPSPQLQAPGRAFIRARAAH